MKRTNRDKDWAFITALGVRMIEAEDERGWMHIFSADTLEELLADHRCPASVAAQRPAIQLALDQDPRTAGAINAERKLWEELDRSRIHILERHLRPYVSAVRKVPCSPQCTLQEDHAVRIDCATRHLPLSPLKDHGLARYVEEARLALVNRGLIPESALTWLPDTRNYFAWLNS